MPSLNLSSAGSEYDAMRTKKPKDLPPTPPRTKAVAESSLAYTLQNSGFYPQVVECLHFQLASYDCLALVKAKGSKIALLGKVAYLYSIS